MCSHWEACAPASSYLVSARDMLWDSRLNGTHTFSCTIVPKMPVNIKQGTSQLRLSWKYAVAYYTLLSTSLARRQVAVFWTVTSGKKSLLRGMGTPLRVPAGGMAQQQDPCAAGPQWKLLPCQKHSSGDHSIAGKTLVLKKSGGTNKPFHVQNQDASSGSIFSPSKSETLSPSFISFSRKFFSFCLLLHSV